MRGPVKRIGLRVLESSCACVLAAAAVAEAFADAVLDEIIRIEHPEHDEPHLYSSLDGIDESIDATRG
jgi:hypothetical protein